MGLKLTMGLSAQHSKGLTAIDKKESKEKCSTI